MGRPVLIENAFYLSVIYRFLFLKNFRLRILHVICHFLYQQVILSAIQKLHNVCMCYERKKILALDEKFLVKNKISIISRHIFVGGGK